MDMHSFSCATPAVIVSHTHPRGVGGAGSLWRTPADLGCVRAPADGRARPSLGADAARTEISSRSAGLARPLIRAAEPVCSSLWEEASASRWTGPARQEGGGEGDGRGGAGPLDGVPRNGLVSTTSTTTRRPIGTEKPRGDRHGWSFDDVDCVLMIVLENITQMTSITAGQYVLTLTGVSASVRRMINNALESAPVPALESHTRSVSRRGFVSRLPDMVTFIQSDVY